jgi:hypothetical protein
LASSEAKASIRKKTFIVFFIHLHLRANLRAFLGYFGKVLGVFPDALGL